MGKHSCWKFVVFLSCLFMVQHHFVVCQTTLEILYANTTSSLGMRRKCNMETCSSGTTVNECCCPLTYDGPYCVIENSTQWECLQNRALLQDFSKCYEYRNDFGVNQNTCNYVEFIVFSIPESAYEMCNDTCTVCDNISCTVGNDVLVTCIGDKLEFQSLGYRSLVHCPLGTHCMIGQYAGFEEYFEEGGGCYDKHVQALGNDMRWASIDSYYFDGVNSIMGGFRVIHLLPGDPVNGCAVPDHRPISRNLWWAYGIPAFVIIVVVILAFATWKWKRFLHILDPDPELIRVFSSDASTGELDSSQDTSEIAEPITVNGSLVPHAYFSSIEEQHPENEDGDLAPSLEREREEESGSILPERLDPRLPLLSICSSVSGFGSGMSHAGGLECSAFTKSLEENVYTNDIDQRMLLVIPRAPLGQLSCVAQVTDQNHVSFDNSAYTAGAIPKWSSQRFPGLHGNVYANEPSTDDDKPSDDDLKLQSNELTEGYVTKTGGEENNANISYNDTEEKNMDINFDILEERPQLTGAQAPERPFVGDSSPDYRDAKMTAVSLNNPSYVYFRLGENPSSE